MNDSGTGFHERLRVLRDEAPRADAGYVLYWMIAARRTRHNFALQRAADWSARLGLPLLVFEPLRCGYDWAAVRFHRFVIDGMADNARACRAAGVAYYPYVEPTADAGRGLAAALATHAAVTVVDDAPAFFYPRLLDAAAERLDGRLEAVDSNGLLPLAATDRAFPTAYSFRRYLQGHLLPHLRATPVADPMTRAANGMAKLGPEVTGRWPAAFVQPADADTIDLALLPIDRTVGSVDRRGGSEAAARLVERFFDQRVDRYGERGDLCDDNSSGLSPYLHFGHVSPHAILSELESRYGWSPELVTEQRSGKKSGWWNVRESVEGFLDQLVTWRELGLNFCYHRDDYDRFESLPDWAQGTLGQHADDARPYSYSSANFEAAETHDALWNAAQRQLVRDGVIQSYMRMLWAKKILHWTDSPFAALETMLHLNNKYALDGRDANSYSGIFWCLGRYDRAWGPERPVFGKVRFMTSDSTARKFRVERYLARYTEAESSAPG